MSIFDVQVPELRRALLHEDEQRHEHIEATVFRGQEHCCVAVLVQFVGLKHGNKCTIQCNLGTVNKRGVAGRGDVA